MGRKRSPLNLNTMSSKIFNHKHPFTVGVEEEYMICSPSTGELINRANEIMSSIDSDLKQRFSYELLLSEIEINTSVCRDVDEAVNELIFFRNYVRLLGEKLDYRIGISGTHPTAKPEDQKFVENNSYNWVSDQLHYYAERNITFSTHVHVAVPDGETAIHTAGALYDLVGPSENNAKSFGEWNNYIIEINHNINKGSVSLNGINIVNFPLSGEEWDEMISNSKFKDWSEFGKHKTGRIGLQDHGGRVSYKNIKIKEL